MVFAEPFNVRQSFKHVHSGISAAHIDPKRLPALQNKSLKIPFISRYLLGCFRYGSAFASNEIHNVFGSEICVNIHPVNYPFRISKNLCAKHKHSGLMPFSCTSSVRTESANSPRRVHLQFFKGKSKVVKKRGKGTEWLEQMCKHK